MKWVTWADVGVDRMACAWLIKRFLDPQAEFSFIPYGAKPRPEQGEHFDIPDVRLSHRRGHCTFHTILQEYDLKDPVLQRIARIVDEADAVQDVTLEPAAPGLDLICGGIRRTSPDDEAALEKGNFVIEALYAQLAVEPST
ncbi:MAG TPA: chromate resistance protein ChrB domain-containing protein [Symbiobacteriaceae bacterium]